MTAKDYVRQIKKIDTTIANKLVELKQTKIALSTKMIEEDIHKLFIEKQQIIKTIEELPEPEYDVLHKVYVQNETLQEVAAQRNISYSLATTLHGRALKILDEILCKRIIS